MGITDLIPAWDGHNGLYVIIRVYSRKGTATSVTLMTACTFMPTILFRFLAGSMVESFTALGVLSGFFGTGKGSGIGLMFFIVGIAGMAASFTRLRKPVCKEPDLTETDTLQTKLNGENNNEEQ